MNEVIYYGEKKVNDFTYSADKLAVSFLIDEETYFNLVGDDSLLFKLSGREKKIGENSRNYPYLFSAKYGSGKLVMAMGKPSETGDYFGYLECNPNKCFGDPNCLGDIKLILSKALRYWIWKMDIAVDIPVKYSAVSLVKDRRYYNRSGSSASNLSVYLGKKRGSIGRVKLYNKTRESNLPFDLTRVEMTLGNPLASGWSEKLQKTLPKMFYANYKKSVALGESSAVKLSSTDNVLITLLRASANRDEQFSLLDYKKKNKIKPFVFADEQRVIFDTNAIRSVALSMCDTIAPKNYCIDGSKYAPIPK